MKREGLLLQWRTIISQKLPSEFETNLNEKQTLHYWSRPKESISPKSNQ
jgi:hypothetical protein